MENIAKLKGPVVSLTGFIRKHELFFNRTSRESGL
jgi:hypothetical protein